MNFIYEHFDVFFAAGALVMFVRCPILLGLAIYYGGYCERAVDKEDFEKIDRYLQWVNPTLRIQSVLASAIEQNKKNVVLYMLSRGVPQQILNETQQDAIFCGRGPILSLLLKYGADPNARCCGYTMSNLTPLEFATFEDGVENRKKMIEILCNDPRFDSTKHNLSEE